MINIKTDLQFKNEYKVELYRGGVKTASAKASNTITKAIISAINRSSDSYIKYIKIGTGTGTPSYDDTSLFKPLGNFINCSRIAGGAENNTAYFTVQATFPATSQYVGEISELGLYTGDAKFCVTHAMLQDSQGNPITISKTDLDIMIITATIYVTITSNNFDYTVPFADSLYAAYFIRSYLGMPDALNGKSLSGSEYTTMPSLMHYDKSLLLNYDAINGPSPTLYSIVAYFSVLGHPKALFSEYNSAYDRIFLAGPTRLSPEEYNRGYIKYISNSFGYAIINSTNFPVYKLHSLPVGKGDGVKTNYTVPISNFVDGTDILKVNNIVMIRGTDYTIASQGNSLMDASESLHLNSKILKADLKRSSYATIDNAVKVPFVGFSYTSGYYIQALDGSASYVVFDALEPFAVNTINIPKVRSGDWSESSGVSGYSILFEYSDDNVNWSTALEIKDIATGKVPMVPTGGPTYSFDTITARYWRLSIQGGSSYLFMSNSDDIDDLSYIKASQEFIGLVGSGIQFTVPPAVDADITIEVSVDKPYKTKDYVIDVSRSLAY